MTSGETDVIKAILNAAVADNCVITVEDGLQCYIHNSRDVDAVISFLGKREHEWVQLNDAKTGRGVGRVLLVYGDPDDEVVENFAWTDGQENRMSEIIHAADGVI